MWPLRGRHWGSALVAAIVVGLASLATPPLNADEPTGEHDPAKEVSIHHWTMIAIPEAFQTTHGVDGTAPPYGGDIRIGDLRNTGQADFIVYRSLVGGHKHGGLKPVFIGAFDQAGNVLWQQGEGGVQPARPGPLAIHDIDGDGRTEVIHLWKDPDTSAPDNSLGDVAVQIRDGATGTLKKELLPGDLPPELAELRGAGSQWVHQRILICNLRGTPTPRDFIFKAGNRLFAFDQELNLMWTYDIPYGRRPTHSAYIPAVGDIDGDGRDEVTGGRYLVDDDGSVLFDDTEGRITPHCDSVAITEWDGDNVRLIASGGGQVLDATGKALIRLGEEVVPHGQEVRVARFIKGDPKRQMVIRWKGHSNRMMSVDLEGNILTRFRVNGSPNNTGMEVVYWFGPDRAALLHNGGMLWDPVAVESWTPPNLPPLQGPRRMGWYHCIPADLNGDGPEEMVLYNPWDNTVHVYGSTPPPDLPVAGFKAGPRQYNPRLMD